MPEIEIAAADGSGRFGAYVAMPKATPAGAVVMIQEIFGVNGHIRSVADGYAAEGLLAIAPALFDRIEPGLELGYTPPDIERGRDLKGRSTTESALSDVEAAMRHVAEAGKVGVVGYCWGGFLAWVSVTRLTGVSAAVAYYGGGVGAVAHEQPNCPVLMHFGEKDHAIPLTEVDKVRAAHPAGVEIHVYPSGHGFNCDERGSYQKEAADDAWARTLSWFGQYVKSPVVVG